MLTCRMDELSARDAHPPNPSTLTEKRGGEKAEVLRPTRTYTENLHPEPTGNESLHLAATFKRTRT